MKTVRSWLSAVALAVLSGAYWFLFFLFAESWTASDYRADLQPSETYLAFKAVVALIVGPLLFASLIMIWRATTFSRKD